MQIQALKLSKCYHAKVHLDKDAKDEFFWWIENLRLYNRKSLILPPADLCISTDASTKGWGATCQEISTGGPWSQEEQKAHINILELKAAHLAILTFTKFQIVQRIHVQMDNKIALSYLVKMGGTHNKDTLGLSKQIWYYLQSKKITIRVPTRSFECDSRLRVPQFSRQERLETLPRSVCKNLSEIRYSQYRPFCIPDVSSTSSLHGQEARSGKSGNQCHVSTMDKNVLICISPIQPNTLGIIKGKERSDHNDIGDTNMAIASMIFSSSEHVYPQSVFVNTSERPTSGPIRKTSSFSSKPNSKTGGLVDFRKSLASKGISDKAAKLISDSRRGSSISSYESTWRQWAGWCGKREVNLFQCPLKSVLDCLICLKRGWPIEQLMHIDPQYRLIMNHYMDTLLVGHHWSLVC